MTLLPKSLSLSIERIELLYRNLNILRSKYHEKIEDFISTLAVGEHTGIVDDRIKVRQALIINELDIIGAQIKGFLLSIEEDTLRIKLDLNNIYKTMNMLNSVNQNGNTLKSLSDKIAGGDKVYDSFLKKEEVKPDENASNVLDFFRKKPDPNKT